jgi:hypothetical protein
MYNLFAESCLNKFNNSTDRNVLQDAGKVKTVLAKTLSESGFKKYRIVQDRSFKSDFVRILKNLLVNQDSDEFPDY